MFTWRVEVVFAALSLALMVWVMWRGYLGYAVYIGATLIIEAEQRLVLQHPPTRAGVLPVRVHDRRARGQAGRAHTYTVLNMTALATVGVVLAYTRAPGSSDPAGPRNSSEYCLHDVESAIPAATPGSGFRTRSGSATGSAWC